MTDPANPPPASGESTETGDWDRSGIAPRWRRYRAHESYTRHVPSAVVAGAVALIVSLLTNWLSANRSEAFHFDQEQRQRIEAVRADINTLLNAIADRDDQAVELATQRVEISSTFLPAYRSLLVPLHMAILGKQSDLESYEFLAIDPETGQRHLDEAEIAKIQADGWRDIRWQALKVQSQLLLSPDPYTLECNTEWCDQLAF